jgi:CheY-like chemotaxis protein
VPDTTRDRPKPGGNGDAKQSGDVLLVEDHPDTSRIMARVLTSWGHTVIPAHSVAEACRLARHEKIDLVISDIGLPDGTGVEFITALRTHSAVPAIALTGYGMEDDVKRCFAAGFQTHITKPVSIPKLESAIHELIDAEVKPRRGGEAENGLAESSPSPEHPPHPAHTSSHA